MSNCPVCGNPSKPGEKFCMKCGYSFPMNQPGMAPVQGQPRVNQPQMQYNQGYANQGQMAMGNMPVAPKKKKSIVPIIIAIVALVIVVIGGVIGFKIYSENSGYKGIVKKFAKSIETSDEELYDSIENPEFAGILSSAAEISDYTGGYNPFGSGDSFFEAITEGLEEEVGEVESVEYEIKKVKENAKPNELLDELGIDLDEYEEELEYAKDWRDDEEIELMEGFIEALQAYDEMADNCKEAVKVTLKIKITGDEDSTKDEISLLVIKNDGKWSLVPCVWEW